MRITTRRTVGWLTSVNPAAAKMLAAADVELSPGDVHLGLGDHRASPHSPRVSD
jgi:hypothetical protein